MIRNKYKHILDNLRDKFMKRGGKRHYNYFDIYEEEKYKDDLFPANNQSIFYTKSKVQEVKEKWLANEDV